MQPQKILNAILRRDLVSFIHKSFNVINPDVQFMPNWHIDLIAEKLMAVKNGEIKRLIINMPPRALKSLSISVAWSSWIMGNDPSARIIAASYGQYLAVKHSLDARAIVSSDWYGNIFPEFKIIADQNEKHKFMTTKRGFRLATSIGGALTGEGGDIIIVDDPHNPRQANSPLQRQAAIDWFEQTLLSRLDDKVNGKIVIVMQRLHQQDLTGHLLDKNKNGWHVLTLPSICEEDRRIITQKHNFIWHEGDLLNAKRDSMAALQNLKQEMGAQAFSAQYQQNPIANDDSLIKKQWLKYYLELPKFKHIVQSWDCAVKVGAKNDYSVCSTWGVADDGYYLIDLLRRKMEFPQLLETVKNVAKQHNPIAILIEDASSGQSLIQELQKNTPLPVVPIRAKNDKTSRALHTQILFESGKIFLPKTSAWLMDYEYEITSFPNSLHDDQLDSTSQFINFFHHKLKQSKPNIRSF
jgi:predicted phage terminase large subunit-like protein